MNHPAHRRLTPRQEQFAVDVASGTTPVDALLRAYRWSGTRDTASSEAAKLARKRHVAGRIAELRDQYAKAAVEASRGPIRPGKARPYTLADAMADLDAAWELAVAKQNPAAMVRVVEVRIKLYGLRVGDAQSVERSEPTYEELVELLARLEAVKTTQH